MNRLVSHLILLFATLSTPVWAVSEADLLPVDQAYPISIEAVTADSVRIRWGIADGYYLYKQRTAIRSDTPEIALDRVQLPAGKTHHDAFFGDVETYRNALVATVHFTAPPGATHLMLHLKYQGCADMGVCYPPQNKRLRIPLAIPTAAVANKALLDLKASHDDEALPEDQAFQVEAIVGDAETLLLRLIPAPGYYLYRDKLRYSTRSQGPPVFLGKPKLPEAIWYPDPEFGTVPVYFETVEIALPLMRANAKASTLDLTVDYQGCKENGICYPPMQRIITLELPAGSTTSSVAQAIANSHNSPASQWGKAALAVALALLGGLILNLMPCVLPVLSFKAIALAKANSPGHARRHALWYTAGVISSFAALGITVLALRAAGQALGWGFQLQQPIIVGGLALLMFGIGLMMSGVFHWGARFAGMGQSLTEKSGAAGDFFTGVLAVVVASPCTAPFMGSALAFAFTAHWALALSVFLALGLGLALPFLLIGFVPGLANKLPKPGAWMLTLKHALAYPMYLTAVWLAWVFGHQKGVNGLALLLIAATVLAAALWCFERQKIAPSRKAQSLALVLGLLAATSFGLALQQVPTQVAAKHREQNYETFSRQRLAQLRAQGTPVFVDMTADWCITCKLNEKAVLHTAAFTQLLKETGAVYLVGDWTNQDPEISAYLDQYHSPGVPLYVVYPKGPGEGQKLPQLLTLDILRTALAP